MLELDSLLYAIALNHNADYFFLKAHVLWVCCDRNAESLMHQNRDQNLFFFCFVLFFFFKVGSKLLPNSRNLTNNIALGC